MIRRPPCASRAAAAVVGALSLGLPVLAPSARAQQLVVRSSTPPVYPDGASGVVDVTVLLVIDEQGKVASAEVRNKEPPDAPASFDAAALASVRALQVEPVLVGGLATRVQTEVRLHFEPPAPPAALAAPPSPASPAPVPAEPDAPPAVPEQVATVRGRRADTTAGEVHLHGPLLQEVPHRSAEQMLTSAPGILLTNHGGEGHAPAIFLRGFDAGEGQDLEFRLDGVPLNQVSNAHSHGYADVHFIIPELVDELHVVEGPFDPRQGDFAVAGTAEYHLGLHERGLQLKGGLGSWGTRRALLLWGPEGEEPGTFAGVDLRQSDGFGVNRASASASAMAQYEARLAEGSRLFVFGQSYATQFDSAGVVRNDDFLARRLPCKPDADSQFFCTYDPNQGGAVSRHGLSVRLQKKVAAGTLEQQAFWSLTHLRLRENFTGFLNDLPGAGQDQRGDDSEKVYDAATVGLRGSLRSRRTWNERPQEIEVGYSARYDAGDSLSRRLRAKGGEAYKRDLDVGFGVGNISFSGAFALRPLPRLALRGGLRAEAFSFSILDRNRPTLDRQGKREPSDYRDAFGLAFLPRLSGQWTVTRGLDWVTSYGEGARSSDASALSDGEFAPFGRVRALETGLLHERAGEANRWTLSTRASAFYTRVEHALIFDETAARNVLEGPTNRLGALALARLGLGGWLDAQASVTYAEAYQPPAAASWWQLTAGERTPYVPRWVTRLDASTRRTSTVLGREVQWGTGLGVTYIAPRPLPLGQFGDPIFTVDGAVHARWRWLEVGLSAQNLLDARSREAEFNYASNFRSADLPPSLRAARTFAAGAPRMLLATLAVHFDAAEESAPDHDMHQEEAR